MRRSSARLNMSAAARDVEADIALAARTDVRVLISGEPGVGKASIARAIHDRGRRQQAAFVALRCDRLIDSAVAPELYGTSCDAPWCDGHDDGALIGAIGGTLFLDEVGRAGPRFQTHLLRLIEGNAPLKASGVDYDVRFIASTEASLASRVAAGEFREELFYRLNVVHVAVPPLRERREDIALLLTDALARCAAEARCQTPELTVEAWRHLCEYRWPGNLREMRLLATRLVGTARGGRIGVDELPAEISQTTDSYRVHSV